MLIKDQIIELFKKSEYWNIHTVTGNRLIMWAEHTSNPKEYYVDINETYLEIHNIPELAKFYYTDTHIEDNTIIFERDDLKSQLRVI